MNSFIILLILRFDHKINPSSDISVFSHSSGPSILCAHLFTKHLETWVESCDKCKIPITAEAAKGPVANYCASKGKGSANNASASAGQPHNIQEYSYEAFVNMITEFIVTDDQV